MDKIDFKYRSTRLFNIVAFLFFCLFIIVTLIIIKYVNSTGYKIVYILLCGGILYLWMYIVNRKVCVLNGSFIIENDKFYYDTLRKSYEIKFNEVDYLSIEKCLDKTSLFNIENYLYRIKIRDAGSFIFYYNDKSLDEAFKKLSDKLNITIRVDD